MMCSRGVAGGGGEGYCTGAVYCAVPYRRRVGRGCCMAVAGYLGETKEKADGGIGRVMHGIITCVKYSETCIQSTLFYIVRL